MLKIESCPVRGARGFFSASPLNLRGVADGFAEDGVICYSCAVTGLILTALVFLSSRMLMLISKNLIFLKARGSAKRA